MILIWNQLEEMILISIRFRNDFTQHWVSFLGPHTTTPMGVKFGVEQLTSPNFTQSVQRVTLPNFVTIGQAVAKIWWFVILRHLRFVMHCFTYFYTLRVKIFRMFFIRSRPSMTPMNHETFHGNRSARFSEIRKTDTHIHRQTGQLYIYRRLF